VKRLPTLLALGLPAAFLSQCAPACTPAPPPPAPVVVPAPTYPAPTVPPFTFGDGTHLVGSDIPPGMYWTTAADCYWERLANLGDEGVITNSYEPNLYQHIVWVLPTDAAFHAEGCGTWRFYNGATQVTSFGDGDWAVDDPGQFYRGHITPGRWQASNLAGCSWERAISFTHDDDLADNDYEGRTVVDIAATDKRFSSSGCGTWVRIA
jgi:hypothetical protein